MTSAEDRRLAGSVDPSNLHFKKELTQIRKAARAVLKDPGTSSSRRSLRQIHGDAMAFSSEQLRIHAQDSHSNGKSATLDQKKKDKTVCLLNWRDKKSDTGKGFGRKIKDDEGYSSTREDASPEYVDSSSSMSNGGGAGHDSRSDGCLSNSVFNCRNGNLKKPERSAGSSAGSRHHKEKLKMLLSRYTENVANGSAESSVGRDDLRSLVHHNTDDCSNSKDIERASTISSLLVRLKNRKVDDSISYSTTPALSTGIYSRYSTRNPSTAGSWDAATTSSFNADADDEVDDGFDLAGQPGCGIPCYRSRRSTPRSRTGSCCSPSISDTLRKSMICGSRPSYQRRRRRSKASAGQSLVPLLKKGGGRPGSSVGSGMLSDCELLENYGELDLEGLSRLDGKMRSLSRGSREALNGEVSYEGSPENMTTLSYKHRPMFFDELVGQSLVVKALLSAVLRGKVPPLYVFHGPRGVGKTSAARILAAALNCLSLEKTDKPCGVCRECADFVSGKSSYLVEIDGSNNRGIEKMKSVLEKISAVYLSRAISQYMIFVVDQCHLLPKQTWLAFLGLLEKLLLQRVIFILITTDVDSVPPAVLARCQKHLFSKISNGDIVARLMKISCEESLDVEMSALELIASNADGSLRDAETMLEQLSLFGKRITKSMVNELIGVVSDDKLLELLELAMSSNATETVIRARELMDSGMDPIVLVSQLVKLIVDLIAGTYPSVDAKGNKNSFIVSEGEVGRLRHALTVLSEAENRLRVSCERSTWFTATLLQLGSLPSSPSRKSHSTCSRPHSCRTIDRDSNVSLHRETNELCSTTSKKKPVSLSNALSFDSDLNRSQFFDDEALTVLHDESKRSMCTEAEVLLSNIWLKCIHKCHSKTLRNLLHSYGKLVSLSEAKGAGGFVAFIAFEDANIKTRAEGFLSSLTNSFEIILRTNVEVKLILLQEDFPGQKPSIPMNLQKWPTHLDASVSKPDLNSLEGSSQLSRTSFNASMDHHTQPVESISTNACTSIPNDNNSDIIIPPGRIESIIDEQRLETAWLQTMDKSMRSLSRTEQQQVLRQNGVDSLNELDSLNSVDVTLHYCEDRLNHEIEAEKINGETKVRRNGGCPISPSVLHASKDDIVYESGSGRGCGMMLCWNNSKPHRRGKANQSTPRRAHKCGQFSWFGECAKSRRNRYCR
ncbi:replication factor C / DNA polymerase IIIgamma-tau subunit [Striga asiatica]|uniref:Replication factor C / DNA polymerase IIIgamma-tau subunit n=1 Tax=Striga asiatica TaxID=4170 RepID=A0A5A7Q3L0_STRAF|nr:replication factor C / DNA polymerase IIIgamma-tau subunit [Striga asiatica]